MVAARFGVVESSAGFPGDDGGLPASVDDTMVYMIILGGNRLRLLPRIQSHWRNSIGYDEAYLEPLPRSDELRASDI